MSEQKDSPYELRYSIPGRYELAPFGTIYRVQISDDDTRRELFIQLSTDASTSNWQRVGYLMEEAFCELLEDQDFINECLRLYTAKTKEYDHNVLHAMFKNNNDEKDKTL